MQAGLTSIGALLAFVDNASHEELLDFVINVKVLLYGIYSCSGMLHLQCWDLHLLAFTVLKSAFAYAFAFALAFGFVLFVWCGLRFAVCRFDSPFVCCPWV